MATKTATVTTNNSSATPSSTSSTSSSTTMMHTRKLRKSCSLPTCSRTPGECMHCTCDGKCGTHEAGLCGVRREGSGKSCKREGCPRDATCFHSTRATCCHCRNLVSSNNSRASRGKRARTGMMMKHMPTHMGSPSSTEELLHQHHTPAIFAGLDVHTSMPKRQKLVPPITTADAVATRREQLAILVKDAATASPVGELTQRSLAEYAPWRSRQASANLIVLVNSVQFNLHKHPMLLESQLLHTKARDHLATHETAIPVVELPRFPGGADVFELMCIYAYTGEVNFSAERFAAMYNAVHILDMTEDLKTTTQRFLDELVANPSASADIVRILTDACQLAQVFSSSVLTENEQLISSCMNALAKTLPLTVQSMNQILCLPSNRFLRLTQNLLTSRSTESVDPANQECAQTQLTQLHRDAPLNASAAQVCLQVLEDALNSSVVAMKGAEAELLDLFSGSSSSESVFMKMMMEELDIQQPSQSSDRSPFANEHLLSTIDMVTTPLTFSHDNRFLTQTLTETFAV